MSVANMSKRDRCRTEEVYVVGFVPKYIVPKKRSCSIDPFLHPLLKDLEDGFIEGMHDTPNLSHVVCVQVMVSRKEVVTL